MRLQEMKISYNHEICLEDLPEEILLMVFSYLDLKSLFIAARTSSLFKRICYHPTLYRDLNLTPYRHRVSDYSLKVLQNRCSEIRHLDLSLCGSKLLISSSAFIEFLKTSCKKLTRLKLFSCFFLTENCMDAIAEFCPHLEVLDLNNCRSYGSPELNMFQISRLTKLKYLDLSVTIVSVETVTLIVKSCVELEHLFLRNCKSDVKQFLNFRCVAKEIAKNLHNLRTLDIRHIYNLPTIDVEAISSRCQNLKEVNLELCRQLLTPIKDDPILMLVQECHTLKKLLLTGHAGGPTSRDCIEIIAIASDCKELQELNISES